MLKQICFWVLFFVFSVGYSQEINSLYSSKTIVTDSVSYVFKLEENALNSSFFEVTNTDGVILDSNLYHIDFQQAQIEFIQPQQDSLVVNYLKYPETLTKTHQIYSSNLIVPNEEGKHLFQIPVQKESNWVPFDGLNTNGSISRSITVGNNQNLVTQSNLDLQIIGKLSEKVNLKASIQDSNNPLQYGGYSQRIDEFDQIFIELYGNKWRVKAGDLFIENRLSRFLNFNKKVQGLYAQTSFGENDQTQVELGAAIARGQYAKSEFIGQEGNQGPYKLRGQNNELYILIISGSERVFVNGRLLSQGENNDYVIDYNSGEIRFNPTFPITADMRIAIEYQYTDRNFTRFMTYGGIRHQQGKWDFGGYVYLESDMKNQPLQQNLNEEQVEILKQAGNDPTKMVAPSAYQDSYSDNKILYKKITTELYEYFEYSNNPQDTLYQVAFSFVGMNQGNYRLASNAAIGKIYEFAIPQNGIPQGDYEPVIQLVAPVKTLITTVQAAYTNEEKTKIEAEVALSNHDQNLFSSIDDQNNKGWAGNVKARQRLLDTNWKIDAFADIQFVHQNFKTIERLYNIEFNRDWNIGLIQGNQSMISAGINALKSPQQTLTYRFDRLEFSQSYLGQKHILEGKFQHKQWSFATQNSLLKADSETEFTDILRSSGQIDYRNKKYWAGNHWEGENYEVKDRITKAFNIQSQRYFQNTVFAGIGDTAGRYIETGYVYRVNDSLQDNRLKKFTTANSFYVKTQAFKTEKSQLQVYANYRMLEYKNDSLPNENTLNSKITYNDRFFNNLVQWQTIYENTSGALPQQEFTYIEVEPGMGTHMWNNYNGNGIQELEEFEPAPYPDLAIYIRLMLPNQLFIRTHQNRLTQLVSLNFQQWQNKEGWQKTLSHFHNQTTWILDKNREKGGKKIPLLPWTNSEEDVLAENSHFRNTLSFNRGKRRFESSYSYIVNNTKNLLNFGRIENHILTHQLDFNHLVKKIWNYNLAIQFDDVTSNSENYDAKNYHLKNIKLAPKISYLFSASARWDFFYEYRKKENQLQGFETLEQHRLGTSFSFNGKKNFIINGEFSFYQNTFEGNAFSPVAYQMLEGLQPGRNLTWRLLFQRNLTKYLDMNISYDGRSGESAQTIHTGSIQLRAFF